MSWLMSRPRGSPQATMRPSEACSGGGRIHGSIGHEHGSIRSPAAGPRGRDTGAASPGETATVTNHQPRQPNYLPRAGPAMHLLLLYPPAPTITSHHQHQDHRTCTFALSSSRSISRSRLQPTVRRTSGPACRRAARRRRWRRRRRTEAAAAGSRRITRTARACWSAPRRDAWRRRTGG
jgi:hypothetical protein